MKLFAAAVGSIEFAIEHWRVRSPQVNVTLGAMGQATTAVALFQLLLHNVVIVC